MAQICRARVAGQQVVEETEDMLEATRFALSPLIGHELAGLRRDRADQAAYAVHARSIARTVAAMLHSADGDEADRARGRDRRQAQRLQPGRRHGPGDHRALHHRRVGPQPRCSTTPAASTASSRTAYDREHAAASLVRKALLADLREKLDRRIAAQGVNIARLARELRALLAEPARDGWDGGAGRRP